MLCVDLNTSWLVTKMKRSYYACVNTIYKLLHDRARPTPPWPTHHYTVIVAQFSDDSHCVSNPVQQGVSSNPHSSQAILRKLLDSLLTVGTNIGQLDASQHQCPHILSPSGLEVRANFDPPSSGSLRSDFFPLEKLLVLVDRGLSC